MLSQNRSVGSRTLPWKGFLIWSKCEDVVCTLEHLRRDSWGKVGYLRYSSGTQGGHQDCHGALSHHADGEQQPESTEKSHDLGDILGHCHTSLHPSENSRLSLLLCATLLTLQQSHKGAAGPA